ncbi:MAG: hypothetical protein QJT81_02705 [Candidatus Thiothrix putei]|uniref:Uncharacterized protein n=1 Tax=Candidatus Thiothrix putei TaxID=3080811 RepID=A0AA95HHL1_9GAMM|nr:MAG: hypothetical protein QJT81_02705 [Candidatus Thiothrix putei]
MAGDIYFGYDNSSQNKWETNDGYVNSASFMAFGDWLDEALSKDYPNLLSAIKEDEPMAMYNFCDLSAVEYNTVIRALREFKRNLMKPTPIQQLGTRVWEEIAEPFIHKDVRYDSKYHDDDL